jgi:hypothetical protein
MLLTRIDQFPNGHHHKENINNDHGNLSEAKKWFPWLTFSTTLSSQIDHSALESEYFQQEPGIHAFLIYNSKRTIQ